MSNLKYQRNLSEDLVIPNFDVYVSIQSYFLYVIPYQFSYDLSCCFLFFRVFFPLGWVGKAFFSYP